MDSLFGYIPRRKGHKNNLLTLRVTVIKVVKSKKGQLTAGSFLFQFIYLKISYMCTIFIPVASSSSNYTYVLTISLKFMTSFL